MKKLYNTILTIALVVSAFGATAQMTIDPNPVYMDDIDISQFDIVVYGSLTNDASAPVTYTWNRTELEITDGWETAICDSITCYSYESNSPTEFFTLNPGQSCTWDFHLYPFNTEGAAIVRVIISEVDNFSNNETVMYYINQFLGTAEVLRESIQLYPNPTTDQLFVEQSENVSRIELFSLNGEQVVASDLNTDKVVSVGHLSTGTYVARLFDNNGQQVSSNVVIKK